MLEKLYCILQLPGRWICETENGGLLTTYGPNPVNDLVENGIYIDARNQEEHLASAPLMGINEWREPTAELPNRYGWLEAVTPVIYAKWWHERDASVFIKQKGHLRKIEHDNQ